ncbi:MAG: hypothetical protein E7048_00915 [Lentisphaerae bacterium]|nr:hypothetical protein [Lentisphaerota bacterium]
MNLPVMPDFPKGQPPFVALLASHEPFIPHWDEKRKAAADELDVSAGMTLHFEFPDPEKLLETACFDFNRFLEEAALAAGPVKVIVKKTEGKKFESYTLTVTDESVTLESSDTEGIRRGLYYLRDLIAGAPFLKKGSFERTPWLKNRISRCFFGPIKRPPFNIDELMNDIDYYPDEYLSRLAHEGVNGLFLTVVFREICTTTIRPAIPEAAQRIAKLRDTVNRCRRYGIKIFAFCIEPIYWNEHSVHYNPLPEGCECLKGPGWTKEQAGFEANSFCPNSPMAQQYLYECTNSLFKSVPHLGGMITISHGERMTSCLSTIKSHGNGEIPCAKRCEHSIGKILSMVLEPMYRGMKEANPDADLISWLYMPYVDQVGNWITQMPSELNGDIALAFNFESGVNKYQLGKVRNGGDYWLSEVGPSDRFNIIAQAAKGHCDIAAKLQVACSHECATVPYIPAPGLVYRKYKKMHALGVKHVIQCWYFGNYPGVMNEAAGKLAYEDFSGTEEDFLKSLAAPAWGKDYPAVLNAWKYFADGYSNYPLDIQFQYYGPMHDGPVWPLYLKQQLTPLTRSWKPDNFPSGDNCGECMKHFDLFELTELTRRISNLWHKGLEELQKASVKGHELEFTLAEALDIMYRSGHNILKFYTMRTALAGGSSEGMKLLEGMKKIILEEIRGSRRLAEICKEDVRLGYHSEAEVYKFFPEKLLWRARCLEELLAGDMAEAEKILQAGGNLKSFIEKNDEVVYPGQVTEVNGVSWKVEADDDKVTVYMDFQTDTDDNESVFLLLCDASGMRKVMEPVHFTRRKGAMGANAVIECRESAAGWCAEVQIPREQFLFESSFFMGFVREIITQDKVITLRGKKRDDLMKESRLYLHYHDGKNLTKVQL